jgi:hypothetical protein
MTWSARNVEQIIASSIPSTVSLSLDLSLRRSFALWRLPPVLIIQLKRFQFNNYSRRKLTNFVSLEPSSLSAVDRFPSLCRLTFLWKGST